jgi:hypothetical protein
MFPRGVYWRRSQWYWAMRYVVLLPRRVRELYCHTTCFHNLWVYLTSRPIRLAVLYVLACSNTGIASFNPSRGTTAYIHFFCVCVSALLRVHCPFQGGPPDVCKIDTVILILKWEQTTGCNLSKEWKRTSRNMRDRNLTNYWAVSRCWLYLPSSRKDMDLRSLHLWPTVD